MQLPTLTLKWSLLPQKSCIHQVATEPRDVTSFLEANFTLPAPKTEVIPSAMPISIRCRLDLYGGCFWQHSRLWSFQLCRRDVTEVQRQNCLSVWINICTHYFPQKMIFTQRNIEVQFIKAFTAQQGPRCALAPLQQSQCLWAAPDLFFSNLAGPFLLLPRRHSSLGQTHRKTTQLEPLSSHVPPQGTSPEIRPWGQAGSPQLPLTWTWVSSTQRENGHEGIQRLSAADSSCVKQSLLSITGLCADLLSSSCPVDIHRIYYIHADEQMRSALRSISKYQLRNSASITLKHFYNLCWLSIPGWFLLRIKEQRLSKPLYMANEKQ